MKAPHSVPGYMLHLAFYSIKPHGNVFTRFHYECLLTINIFGPQSVDGVYKLLHSHWRERNDKAVRERMQYLITNNYLVRAGHKYHLTADACLLISSVERKLKALVKQYVSTPVGRPVKEKE